MEFLPFRRVEMSQSQKELLSQTVAVGDIIKYEARNSIGAADVSTWVVTSVTDYTLMIKGHELTHLTERPYTRANLDSNNRSLVLPAIDKKTIVDGWKAWTVKCKPAAGEEIGMQYLQKDIQAARDEAARKPAADYIVGTYVVDTDKGKCPASCTPRNPCLGPMCPGRRESGSVYRMWEEVQTGTAREYPRIIDGQPRRGELRCARDMACPLFRSK